MSDQQVAGTPGTGVGSLLGAYAERLSARAKAPGHQNLAGLGCRLCGDATISRSGDEITITAHRAPGILQALYILTLLVFVFGMVAVFFLALPLTPWTQSAFRYEADLAAFTQAAIFAAVALALNRTIAAVSGRGAKQDVQIPLSALRVRVTSVRRRQYLLQGPLGSRGKKSRLILEAASDADNKLLRQIFSVGAR